jgi:hypothetical protein
VFQRRHHRPSRGGASIITKHAEGSDDVLADIQVEVHVAMMIVPLDAGFLPDIWKQAVDVMLEKVPGISRSDNVRIIQMLEADLNQFLRISFARNITRILYNIFCRTGVNKPGIQDFSILWVTSDVEMQLVQMLLEYTQLECGCHRNPLVQD